MGNQIYYIIFGLVLFFTKYSKSFKFSNKFIKSSILNLFKYDDCEYSKYYQMELINWHDNINFNKFYYIIGHKNLDFYLLVNEMKIMDICCIFISISIYQLEDIDFIFSNLIHKKYNDTSTFIKPEINNIKEFTNFLIFDQDKYIGGLFEIYSIMYKNT